ncbi:MAG TPA: hypothetical protein VIL74_04065 [Pyrinomonadaceae bacterium]|jgi:hypothetical protein
MIRKLVSKLNKSITERVVSPRKKYEVPIKIWFEPDRNTGRLKTTVENLVITGETKDMSRTGIGFIVGAIRIQENYLVGGERVLNAELDLPSGKVRLQLVGMRYEEVGQHISTARFLVGAKITQMSDEDREAYEYFLRHGNKRKKGSFALGIDKG